MAKADVGDDVLGDDPTVRRLEDRAADLLGKDDALLVASGTMANQIAAMTFCRPGSEVVASASSHLFNLEVGALSAFAGVQVRPVAMERGRADQQALADAFRSQALQVAATSLLCLENTGDLNRGWAVSEESFSSMATVAHDRSIPVYLDGARIFNAAIALGVSARSLTASADAMMFCLTKGLACPIGSLLLGDRDFVADARRLRQRMGGGWRQAGIIAAAGLVALDCMVDRLAVDHERAQRLAIGLNELGLGVEPGDVDTNVVHVDLPTTLTAQQFADEMAKAGVLVKVIGPYAVRMVTHVDIDDEAIHIAINAAASATDSWITR